MVNTSLTGQVTGSYKNGTEKHEPVKPGKEASAASRKVGHPGYSAGAWCESGNPDFTRIKSVAYPAASGGSQARARKAVLRWAC